MIRQRLWQWTILAVTIAIPLVIGMQALLRLRAGPDPLAGVGNASVVLLCALVLLLLAVVFVVAGLAKRRARYREHE